MALSFREYSLEELDELDKVAERLEDEKDKRFEDIEEKYETNYAVGICNFLREKFPDEFKEAFGDGEEGFKRCVKVFRTSADVWFDKWNDKYASGLLSKARAVMLRLAEERRRS